MEYRISSKAGADFGIWEGDSPAQALLALHRDAEYGPDIVWLEDDAFVFATEEDRELIGGLSSWTVREIEGLKKAAADVARAHLDDPLIVEWREAHPDATAEEIMDDAGPWTLPDGVDLDMVEAAMTEMVGGS